MEILEILNKNQENRTKIALLALVLAHFDQNQNISGAGVSALRPKSGAGVSALRPKSGRGSARLELYPTSHDVIPKYDPIHFSSKTGPIQPGSDDNPRSVDAKRNRSAISFGVSYFKYPFGRRVRPCVELKFVRPRPKSAALCRTRTLPCKINL